MDMNRPLTPQEVADRLRITKNTVYGLIKRGELRAYRVGNKFRVNGADLDAYQGAATSPGSVPDGDGPARDHGREPGGDSAGAAEETGHRGYRQGSAFVLCGQDIILDILAQRLEMHSAGGRVYRSYLGSYNGLHALYQGEVQAATAHLWDVRTGTYNVPFLPHLLPGMDLTLIHLATRMVGYYLPEGNPGNVKGWDDLGRSDLVLANRERGSGMRVLADQRLQARGIPIAQVPGYGKVFPTHLAAALAVARRGADYALGSEKPARQVQGIEFLALQEERYDLVIPSADLDLPMVRAMVGILQSTDFRQELASLGGYGLADTGQFMAI